MRSSGYYDTTAAEQDKSVRIPALKVQLMIYKEKKYILGLRKRSYDFQMNAYRIGGI